MWRSLKLAVTSLHKNFHRLIKETPVETVYIDQNRLSHFNPVIDSIRIYFVLFRFILSSLTTALIDFTVFIICSSLGLNVLLSIFSARLIAGNYNFIINKKIVFRSESNLILSLVKYWALVVLLGSISYLCIQTLVTYLNLNVILSKAIVETLLFVVSFAVQRELIFYSEENTK
jgi:putative flippase GtrA